MTTMRLVRVEQSSRRLKLGRVSAARVKHWLSPAQWSSGIVLEEELTLSMDLNGTFTCTAGDTKEAMVAVLLGPDLKPVDLSTATSVQLVAWEPDTMSTRFKRTASVVEFIGRGTVAVIFEAGDVSQPGIYDALFVVSYPDGREQRYPSYKYLTFEVRRGEPQ